MKLFRFLAHVLNVCVSVSGSSRFCVCVRQTCLFFMCAVFVQLGLAVFVTHLLLLCAVICVRSLAPR